MTTSGTSGIELAEVKQTIRDTFHHLAVEAGLKHTGGHGQYSEFSGHRSAWAALAARVRDSANLYAPASVRAVLSRIDWACA